MAETVTVGETHDVGPLGFSRPSLLGVGTIIWLGSELMFFSGLFAAFFTVRAHATIWPPPDVKFETGEFVRSVIFTVILLLSSFTCQKAVWELEHGRRRATRWWIVLTVVMGALFLGNQLLEWSTVPFTPQSNSYGSMFFVMTGLHGLHVALGLVALVAVLGRMVGRGGDPGELSTFQAVSYYWHFVDWVWVGIYSCLFLLK